MRKIKRSECSVLSLVLKGQWYDMIDKGGKREEYRAYNSYWWNRMSSFLNKTAPGKPMVVAFQNGYTKPSMWFIVTGIHFRKRGEESHHDWGEPRFEHYAISLGERVELVEG